jgi:hypothetical protein
MKRTIRVPQVSNSRLRDELTIEVTPVGIELTIVKGDHGVKTCVLVPDRQVAELDDAVDAAMTYIPTRPA